MRKTTVSSLKELVIKTAVMFVLLIIAFIGVSFLENDLSGYFPEPPDSFEQKFELYQGEKTEVVTLLFKKSGPHKFEVYVGDNKAGTLEWTSDGVVDSKGLILVPADRKIAQDQGVKIERMIGTARFTLPGFHTVLMSREGRIQEWEAFGFRAVAMK